MYIRKISTDDNDTYFFALNADVTKNVRRRVRSKVVNGKGPWINQIVPTFNRLCVSYRGFIMLLMPAFKLRPSLNYAKQKVKELVIINIKSGKTKATRRNTDTPKVGVPHRQSNLGISPQSLLD